MNQRLGIQAAWLLAACALLGCQRAADDLDAKRSPRPPPPASAEVPATLSIRVQIDGKPIAPLDAARLTAKAPDFADEERRAWLLVELLDQGARRDRLVIAARAGSGPEVLLRPGKGPGDPQPALLLSRRGELVALLVDPAQPFPKYHGMGGRLGRRGDELPRVDGVTDLRVFEEP